MGIVEEEADRPTDILFSETGLWGGVRTAETTEGLWMLQCDEQLEQKSAASSSLSVCLITEAHARGDAD